MPTLGLILYQNQGTKTLERCHTGKRVDVAECVHLLIEVHVKFAQKGEPRRYKGYDGRGVSSI